MIQKYMMIKNHITKLIQPTQNNRAAEDPVGQKGNTMRRKDRLIANKLLLLEKLAY